MQPTQTTPRPCSNQPFIQTLGDILKLSMIGNLPRYDFLGSTEIWPWTEWPERRPRPDQRRRPVRYEWCWNVTSTPPPSASPRRWYQLTTADEPARSGAARRNSRTGAVSQSINKTGSLWTCTNGKGVACRESCNWL